ncbi:hypothetical protein N9L47_11250 [Rhodobacteraceae bacterium]|nr:hypothetical protein [Paracoccaceae bacterium]
MAFHSVQIAVSPVVMDVNERAKALADHMSAQLRVKGDTLADVTERAGRRLPKHLRVEAEKISAAENLLQHPRLERLVDEKDVLKSERKLRKFLDRQNPKKARRGEILDMLAKIGFVFVVIVLALFFFLVSRGTFN